MKDKTAYELHKEQGGDTKSFIGLTFSIMGSILLFIGGASYVGSTTGLDKDHGLGGAIFTLIIVVACVWFARSLNQKHG